MSTLKEIYDQHGTYRLVHTNTRHKCFLVAKSLFQDDEYIVELRDNVVAYKGQCPDFEVYQEPRTKVTKFLYAVKTYSSDSHGAATYVTADWHLTYYFYTEAEANKKFDNEFTKYFKLEWSAQEFDE